MLYNELFNEYMSIKGILQSSSEQLNKRNRHRNHIAPIIGHLKLKKIKYKDCQHIVNNVIYFQNLAPKTAKNILAVVKTVLNYAVRNEYIKKNVSNYVEIPNFDNKYNIDLSPIQIKTLINNILTFENPLYRDIFIFALHGRRKSEILSLQWGQIDLESQLYIIPPQKNKSRKFDVHSMTPLLHSLLKKRYIDGLKLLDSSISLTKNFESLVKDSDYVFISSQTGTRLKDVKRPFQKLKKLSGISRFRFHDFRHLLATYTLNNKKLPIEHISQALGHSSIEVTQKYLTKDPNISANVVNSMLEDFEG